MFQINLGPIVKQYAVVIAVNLCVTCTGLGLAWPSPVLVKLRSATDTVLSRPITEEEGSWIVSVGNLVFVFACFLVGYLVDRIGRKSCMVLASVPRLVTSFILLFATEPWMLYFGRAIAGLSDAAAFCIVPMYASEIASKEIRGSLGTFLQIFCSLGIVIMLGIGPFISYISLNILVTVFNVAATIPLLFLPDSPYYLYSKGLKEEAIEVLTFLRGSETLALKEYQDYGHSKTEKTSKMDLLTNKIFLKTLCITMIMGTAINLIGYNAVSLYLQTIFESTQTTVKPEIASAIIGCIQLGASLCTTLVTDRFGRKPILVGTLVGMGIGMVNLGTFFYLRQGSDNVQGFLNYLPLISIIMIVYFYSAGVGSLMWPLISELFDDPTRGAGIAISMFTTGITMFITLKYFVLMIAAVGPAVTYWVFSANTILLSLFIFFCIPETKGKTFAEIQVALGGEEKREYIQC